MSTQAGSETGKGTAYLIGVAARPTVLFMTAFALNITPHEAVHATTGYMLGFSSTLYQMWVNPDAAAATPRQLIAIAVAGPIFSLTVGLSSWLLYRQRYSRKPVGLLLLMLAIVAFYIPLGGSIGGDIHLTLEFGGASKLLMNAISVVAALMLSIMMYFMGKELLSWSPPWFSRSQAGSFYHGWSLADRHHPRDAGLLAIAQISHRPQSRRIGLLAFRRNRSDTSGPDNAAGASSMFANPG